MLSLHSTEVTKGGTSIHRLPIFPYIKRLGGSNSVCSLASPKALGLLATQQNGGCESEWSKVYLALVFRGTCVNGRRREDREPMEIEWIRRAFFWFAIGTMLLISSICFSCGQISITSPGGGSDSSGWHSSDWDTGGWDSGGSDSGSWDGGGSDSGAW